VRKLGFKDAFTLSKIAKKIGIRTDVKGKTQEELGVEMVFKAIENLHLAEAEVTKLFADLKGISEKEVAEMPLMELFQEFQQIDGFKVFFEQARSSMK